LENFGLTLDRSLTFKLRLEKITLKVNAGVNLIRKLAGTVFSTAEYCAPVWLNSAHTQKLDVELNNTMRLITGTVKSTELQWLPVLSNILLRRELALFSRTEELLNLQ
jgi:hypothetical protein